MKIEDIFIGAWVYATDFPTNGKNTAVKVVDINTSKDCINCEYEGITTWVWIGRVEPIPLTAEILEKNGFVYDDTPFVQLWEQFGLSIGGTFGHYWIVCGVNASIDVSDVHRLQAVLKLCKIDKQITL